MARKQSSKRTTLLIVLSLMAIFTGGTIGVMMFFRQQDPAIFVQQAVEFCRTGQFSQALAAYSRAYRESLDPRWIVEAGIVSKDFGDATRALAFFDKAIAARSGYLLAHQNRLELRLELVRQTPTAEGYGNLRKDAEALLAIDPQNGRALFAQSLALSGQVVEDPANARKSLQTIEQAHTLSPNDVDIADTLAKMYERQVPPADVKPDSSKSSPNQAEQVYVQLLKATPQDGVAQLRYAQYLIRQLKRKQDQAIGRGVPLTTQLMRKELDQINGLLATAQKQAGENGEVYLTLADVSLLEANPGKTIEVLNQALTRVPDDLRLYERLASLMMQLGRPADARGILERGLARPFNRESFRGLMDRPRRYRLMCLMGLSHLQGMDRAMAARESLAKAEEARQHAESELTEDHWLVHFLQGRIQQMQGRLLSAATCFRSADKMLDWQNDPTGKLSALLALSDVQWELQQLGPLGSTLTEVLKERPNETVALAIHSWLSLRLGRPRAAAVSGSQAIVGLSQTDSVSLFGRPMIRFSDGTDWIRQTARCWWAGARLENLSTDASKAQERLAPLTGADTLFWAEVCLLYERDKDAEDAYRAAISLDPTQVDAICGLAGIYAFQNRFADLTKLARQTAETLKSLPADKQNAAVAAARCRAEAMVFQFDPALTDDQRYSTMLQSLKAIPDPVERAVRLSQVQCAQGRPGDALAELATVAKTRPDDVELIEKWFAAALEAADWAAAETARARVIELNADGAKGRVCEGRILLARARFLTESAKKTHDTNPQKAGELREEASDLTKEAIDSLRAGAEEARGMSMPRVRLGQAMSDLGLREEARDAYQMALTFNPLDAEALRELAHLARVERVGGIDESRSLKSAIRFSRRGLDGTPLDSWLRSEAEDSYEDAHQAESITRREAILKTRPKDPVNLLRLGVLYDLNGRRSDAEKCYGLAMEASPKNIEMHAQISEVYRSLGDYRRAAQILEDMSARLEGSDKAKALLALARCTDETLRTRQDAGAPPSEIRSWRDQTDQAFVKAFAASPSVDVCDAAADFCLKTRRNEEAVKWLRQGLRAQRHALDDRLLRQKLIRTQLEIRPLPKDIEREIGDYDARFQGFEEVSLLQGMLHAARGELDEAVQKHTRYLDRLLSAGMTAYTRAEELSEAYYLRGNLYLRLASIRPAESVRFLKAAIEDFSHAKAYCPRTLDWSRYAVALAGAYEQAGRDDSAMAELQTALREYPEAEAPARQLIDMLGRQGKWGEQEAVIRQQISLKPNDWQWPCRLGEALERRKMPAEAEKAYRQSAELSDFGAHGIGRKGVVGLMSVLFQRGKCADIVALTEKHIRPEDRDHKLWTLYGAALHKTGAIPDALEAWASASGSVMRVDEQSYVAQSMSFVLGQEPAIQVARQMVEKRKGSIGPTMLLALLLDHARRPDEAIRLVEQAQSATTQPSARGHLLTYMGILMTSKEDFSKAAELYRQALDIDGDNNVALNNLAFIMAEKLNRPADAIRYAQRAAELSPDLPDVLDTLGWCLALNGEYQAAVGVLSRIPSHKRAAPFAYHLAETYRRMKQYDSARQVAEQGLKLQATDEEKPYQVKLRQLLDQIKSSS